MYPILFVGIIVAIIVGIVFYMKKNKKVGPTGISNIIVCPSGSHLDGAECVLNTIPGIIYVPPNHTVINGVITKCNIGEICSIAGMTGVQRIPDGYYLNENNKIVACAAGTYYDNISNGKCVPCPYGSTSGIGTPDIRGCICRPGYGLDVMTDSGEPSKYSTRCEACIGGYSEGNVCKFCKYNNINTITSENDPVSFEYGPLGSTSQSDCRCPKGNIYNADHTFCVPCPTGMSSVDSKTCLPCIDGKINTPSGPIDCRCPPGHVLIGPNTCIPLFGNLYSTDYDSVDPKKCDKGYYVSPGRTECVQCLTEAEFNKNPISDINCNCPEGQYGIVSCDLCPTGTSTIFPNSTNINYCISTDIYKTLF